MLYSIKESEEIKSNSLDKELKMKESELKLQMQEKTDTEEVGGGGGVFPMCTLFLSSNMSLVHLMFTVLNVSICIISILSMFVCPLMLFFKICQCRGPR